MRVKIARIATACAARLFSTDSEAKKVIVKKEHVDFVVEEMDRSYRKPAMAYYEYARAYQQANTITKERGEHIKKELERYEDSDNLITGLLKMPWFNKGQLRDTLPYPKDEFEKLWRFMMQNNLITPRATGYKKTPAFTEFLKKVGSIFSGFTRDGERHLKSVPPTRDDDAVGMEVAPLPEEPPIEYEVSEDQDWQQVSMELLEEKDGDD